MSLYFHEKSLFLDATKTDKNGFFSFFFFFKCLLGKSILHWKAFGEDFCQSEDTNI